MSITLLDVTNRPKAPPIPGATDSDRRRGHHLALAHRAHLKQIDRVHALIAHIEAGMADPGELATVVTDLQMMQNYRSFGGMCGQECQILTMHHTMEDNDIFPVLRARGTEGLRRVLDKLAAEHLIVHALLVELQHGAEAIVASPTQETFSALKDTFQRLDAVVRSHFGYEETQLEEALGAYSAI